MNTLTSFFEFQTQSAPIVKVRSGTLTGKCRFRLSWLGKCILQVEYYHLDAYNGNYREDAKTAGKKWRDLTAQELRLYKEAK
jgi:hypothetical protein